MKYQQPSSVSILILVEGTFPIPTFPMILNALSQENSANSYKSFPALLRAICAVIDKAIKVLMEETGMARKEQMPERKTIILSKCVDLFRSARKYCLMKDLYH